MKIFCWECGEQISNSAPSCPKCGAPQKVAPAIKPAMPLSVTPFASATTEVAKSDEKCKPRNGKAVFLFVVSLVALCVVGGMFFASIATIPFLSYMAEEVSEMRPGEERTLLRTLHSFAAAEVALTVLLFVATLACFLFVIFAKDRKKSASSRHVLSNFVVGFSAAVCALASALVIVTMATYFWVAKEALDGYMHSYLLSVLNAEKFASTMFTLCATAGVFVAAIFKAAALSKQAKSEAEAEKHMLIDAHQAELFALRQQFAAQTQAQYAMQPPQAPPQKTEPPVGE
jgi:magnesium-transporting ATPase (P-type)